MVAVERISHYLSLPSEAPEIVENKRPGRNWPSNGTICLEKLKVFMCVGETPHTRMSFYLSTLRIRKFR